MLTGIQSSLGTSISLIFLIELSFSIVADAGGVGIDLGAVVAEEDQGFSVACVLEGDASFGAGFGAEVFVLGQLVKTDELGAVKRLTCLLYTSDAADE